MSKLIGGNILSLDRKMGNLAKNTTGKERILWRLHVIQI